MRPNGAYVQRTFDEILADAGELDETSRDENELGPADSRRSCAGIGETRRSWTGPTGWDPRGREQVFGHPRKGYGLVVQEELVSPASMQYSLPSPLGIDPYWQEVSSMDCAPIATTEEDTLMDMSGVQICPSGNSHFVVGVEDSSLECSNADDSEALLNRSPDHSRSETPGGNGPLGFSGQEALSDSNEFPEDLSIGADLNCSGAGLSGGVNINVLERGQGLERKEGAVGDKLNNIKDNSSGGLQEGAEVVSSSLEGSLSLISGQQQMFPRVSDSPVLRRRADLTDDRLGGGSLLSYLQDQEVPGWNMAPEPTQNRIGSSHCNPRQAIESVISSVRAAVDCDSNLSRKALIEPVRDTGHSEIIHMHYQGTQLFEKGLGFPSRTPRGWEDMHLREQGEKAEDLAGDKVSEEQFTDEHGNIVTKKQRIVPTCSDLPLGVSAVPRQIVIQKLRSQVAVFLREPATISSATRAVTSVATAPMTTHVSSVSDMGNSANVNPPAKCSRAGRTPIRSTERSPTGGGIPSGFSRTHIENDMSRCSLGRHPGSRGRGGNLHPVSKLLTRRDTDGKTPGRTTSGPNHHSQSSDRSERDDSCLVTKPGPFQGLAPTYSQSFLFSPGVLAADRTLLDCAWRSDLTPWRGVRSYTYDSCHHSQTDSACRCPARQIIRKVVRRGKEEEGGQELITEGMLQEHIEPDVDGEQYMSYAILGRDSKVGF
ncbi:Ankyrin-1 [Triplophysa tibetana]|uniref:Ankyrin-1 n=1 Tax=Triplophysa tibetana TaxID=1572043 RepID=A0A5A9P3S8_9TELE|nr:Ankyrin-1 [Triplophysa tibetana]